MLDCWQTRRREWTFKVVYWRQSMNKSFALLACVFLMAGSTVALAAKPSGKPATKPVTKPAGKVEKDPFAHLPKSIQMDALIRDFKARDNGGHPDFQNYANGYITINLVQDALDAEGKPAFRSNQGLVITEEYRNEKGQAIHPKLANKPKAKVKVEKDDDDDDDDGDDDDKKGGKDSKGSENKGKKADTFNDGDDDHDHGHGNDDKDSKNKKNDFKKSKRKFDLVPTNDTTGTTIPSGQGVGSATQLSTEANFNQWFRDIPGVNMSKVVPLTLNRVENTNRYVMDSRYDEPWKSLGGFFPINGDLFGNYGSWEKNFHFTTEIRTNFVYERGANHVFTFSGDDDVWVYIDGKLVMDLGGLHPRREQTLELDRLDFLEDNRAYELVIFHAERHTTESNFRVETTLVLRNAEMPNVTNMFD
jgi:fibro-slime domain-containing protein